MQGERVGPHHSGLSSAPLPRREVQESRMDLSAPRTPLTHKLLVTGLCPSVPLSSEIFIQDLPPSLIMKDLIHSALRKVVPKLPQVAWN